ncbi:glucosaminidase domain-containing protein [Hugonella massiliensis]|uniref:glucosaminidase domain-containing protein n=1 Tax=Hugonella massiliensis TaxID=1720315 RepID=UPI00073F5010|nr:glucosaminidase domain-containing protein [Hugonella massiliensis]MDD6729677.1 glucosaminidase domain-containing protein [Eggerthellaceae bacterium]
MDRTFSSKALRRPLAAVALVGLVAALGAPATAMADEVSRLQGQVDATASALQAAKDRAVAIDSQIEENDRSIDRLEELLQTRQLGLGPSDRVSVNLRMQDDATSTAFSAPAAESDATGLAGEDLHRLISEKTSLEATQANLQSTKAQTQDAIDRAAQSLAEAEAAQAQAESAAQAEAQAQAAAESARAAYVAEWAPRIDAYLAGSALAGTGEAFACAAYDYGVDPRFSPAISAVESSKGAKCFKAHNAWGWGRSSWGSWEEAIRAHVAGLARSYGGELTKGAAQKYCTSNPSGWYANVSAQMATI